MIFLKEIKGNGSSSNVQRWAKRRQGDIVCATLSGLSNYTYSEIGSALDFKLRTVESSAPLRVKKLSLKI